MKKITKLIVLGLSLLIFTGCNPDTVEEDLNNINESLRNSITSILFTDDYNVTHGDRTNLPPNINIDIGFYNSDTEFINSAKVIDKNEETVYTKMRFDGTFHTLYIPDGNFTYGEEYTLQIDNLKDIHFSITSIKLSTYFIELNQGESNEVSIERLLLEDNMQIDIFDKIEIEVHSAREKANIEASLDNKTIKIVSNKDDILSDIILDSVDINLTYQEEIYKTSIAVSVIPK